MLKFLKNRKKLKSMEQRFREANGNAFIAFDDWISLTIDRRTLVILEAETKEGLEQAWSEQRLSGKTNGLGYSTDWRDEEFTVSNGKYFLKVTCRRRFLKEGVLLEEANKKYEHYRSLKNIAEELEEQYRGFEFQLLHA
ncbi:hypothetical protein [Paenibacillus sp. FSL P4-0288]|uniref:hypothetical protein n=1 Tax=Paenibacillus sp. FSL P4-0288 TaxID=2921633 RepID=UPI0030F4F061